MNEEKLHQESLKPMVPHVIFDETKNKVYTFEIEITILHKVENPYIHDKNNIVYRDPMIKEINRYIIHIANKTEDFTLPT